MLQSKKYILVTLTCNIKKMLQFMLWNPNLDLDKNYVYFWLIMVSVLILDLTFTSCTQTHTHTAVSKYKALTCKHLAHHSTKACVPVLKKLRSSICSQVKPCSTLESVANPLPAMCFLKSPKGWKSLGMRSGQFRGWPVSSLL